MASKILSLDNQQNLTWEHAQEMPALDAPAFPAQDAPFPSS